MLREGIQYRLQGVPSRPKGSYGLATLLLLLAFPILNRVRNQEALRFRALGEWGAIPGLHHCPEVRTPRGRVKSPGRGAPAARNWQALLVSWMAEGPEVRASQCVDGHVKVYSGHKG